VHGAHCAPTASLNPATSVVERRQPSTAGDVLCCAAIQHCQGRAWLQLSRGTCLVAWESRAHTHPSTGQQRLVPLVAVSYAGGLLPHAHVQRGRHPADHRQLPPEDVIEPARERPRADTGPEGGGGGAGGRRVACIQSPRGKRRGGGERCSRTHAGAARYQHCTTQLQRESSGPPHRFASALSRSSSSTTRSVAWAGDHRREHTHTHTHIHMPTGATRTSAHTAAPMDTPHAAG
jgi:hypothetical protein